jgi:hypothetical protein
MNCWTRFNEHSSLQKPNRTLLGFRGIEEFSGGRIYGKRYSSTFGKNRGNCAGDF